MGISLFGGEKIMPARLDTFRMTVLVRSLPHKGAGFLYLYGTQGKHPVILPLFVNSFLAFFYPFIYHLKNLQYHRNM